MCDGDMIVRILQTISPLAFACLAVFFVLKYLKIMSS